MTRLSPSLAHALVAGRNTSLTRAALALRAAAAAATLAAACAPQAASAASGRSWILPDQLKLQLAGNVGFISPGVGYAWAGRRLEADLFLGWVPRAVGGEDIVAFTGKLTYLPWEIALGRQWFVRPFSAALQLTYTYGDEYFLTLPSRYRPDYYELPSALRAGVGFGGVVGRKGRGWARELALYWELVALDAMVFLWAKNTDALGPADVFSLALGLRIAL